MDLASVPWSAIGIGVTLLSNIIVNVVSYNVFKTRTELGIKSINDNLFATNERVTKLAEGVSSQRTDLTEFKEHVRAHYVEAGDLAEVKLGFQASMNDLRDDVRLATATMGDVRDTVIVIASKISPDKPVPPARRRPSSKPGA